MHGTVEEVQPPTMYIGTFKTLRSFACSSSVSRQAASLSDTMHLLSSTSLYLLLRFSCTPDGVNTVMYNRTGENPTGYPCLQRFSRGTGLFLRKTSHPYIHNQQKPQQLLTISNRRNHPNVIHALAPANSSSKTRQFPRLTRIMIPKTNIIICKEYITRTTKSLLPTFHVSTIRSAKLIHHLTKNEWGIRTSVLTKGVHAI